MSEQKPTSPPLTCPSCGATTKQHRAGKNQTGTARRECRHCGRTYTPAPQRQGYDLSVRRQALKLYVDGTNFRRIARHLGVNPQSVANWVNAAAANLPAPPLPTERQKEASVETLELDELYWNSMNSTRSSPKKRAGLPVDVRRSGHALPPRLRRGLGPRLGRTPKSR